MMKAVNHDEQQAKYKSWLDWESARRAKIDAQRKLIEHDQDGAIFGVKNKVTRQYVNVRALTSERAKAATGWLESEISYTLLVEPAPKPKKEIPEERKESLREQLKLARAVRKYNRTKAEVIGEEKGEKMSEGTLEKLKEVREETAKKESKKSRAAKPSEEAKKEKEPEMKTATAKKAAKKVVKKSGERKAKKVVDKKSDLKELSGVHIVHTSSKKHKVAVVVSTGLSRYLIAPFEIEQPRVGFDSKKDAKAFLDGLSDSKVDAEVKRAVSESAKLREKGQQGGTFVEPSMICAC